MPKSNYSRTKKAKEIYMDYASGADPNPSAIHALGLEEKKKLEGARNKVAGILGARPDEIIFTSGGTEANNLAILGMRPGHVVTTNIEHVSVLEASKFQNQVTFVEVEKNGIVDPKKIQKAIKRNTILVSVMYANNEIGTIQPIKEIAKEIRHYNKVNSKKIIFHTDAVQAVNYLPINVEKLGVDLMSFNAAKIYGPKGIGVLYKKRNVPLRPIMHGGDQEGGLRPGTENTPGAVALARALEQTEKIKEKEAKRLTALRDYFISELQHSHILKNIGMFINGDLKERLPNNINITIPNISSDLLVIELSARGIMASAKSACKAGDGKASHVIKAINKDIKETDGSIRFSLGRDTTKKDIDYTLKALLDILNKLKKWYD